ncbi:NAD(P)H-dependent oxidoreductase [Nodosilinea sp. LEGE 07088]|uniref:FMN-dependent NADH-azoreductase n=1 Tax=Nodosilinea sp. LEGE 07088 TaxID=2777968 RepID=UPI0018804D0C|nr:NAD(P)H-dependent oxidoreductase [Nodosilinea sp. LEGE 07088]MBE9140207.1 NAD(P)H-dependent oxidoreductase [Nodosilinea sp. LEGE 07088]
MKTILQIDASARVTRSLSRGLTTAFVEHWQKTRPHDTWLKRDVGLNPPSAISEDWIAAAFKPDDQRTPEHVAALQESDELLAELEPADVIVIGTPMYNYSMPSALKAWIDQVIRIGRTFSFDLTRGEQPVEPIQTGKILVILTASGEGGFEVGGVHAAQNHLDTAIVTASRLLGVSEHHVIRVEYQEFGGDRHQQSIKAAHAAIPKLVQQLNHKLGI